MYASISKVTSIWTKFSSFRGSLRWKNIDDELRRTDTLSTGCGKSRSFHCINYRCKESELLGLPLCVLCFSIFSVLLSIEHFQFALIHFLRLDSSHVILNVFNSHVRAPSVGRVRSPFKITWLLSRRRK